MRRVDFDADQFLVNAGDHSRHVFLLQSGLVRLFYNTPDGKERNKAFFGEGDITGAISAAMTGSPAPFSIQALEAGSLIQTDFEPLHKLAPEHPQASQLMIDLLAKAFIRNERREALFLTGNAEQRYRSLIENEPWLLDRVPQFHIASYIGVDAVSLSRLKRKLDDDNAG